MSTYYHLRDLLIVTVQDVVVIVDVVAETGVVASVVEIIAGVFVVELNVGKVAGVISEAEGSFCCRCC